MSAAGFLPTPSSFELADFSVPEISLPEQPALLADLSNLGVDLPAIGKGVEDTVARVFPRPPSEVPQTLATPDKADVASETQIVTKTDDGPKMPMDVVHFEFDDAGLNDLAVAQLNDFAIWLENNPNTYISIVGHTDLIGPENYNYSLGKSRAEQVKAYLMGKGIPVERINMVESYGEAAPVVETERMSPENRRVQLEAMKSL